jgi:2,3-bisphosphoglycerate-independent phosphoglycerate mutase
MKYVLFLCDGMADRPLDELGGRTPMQAADTPNMDRIAKEGVTGLVQTIPEGAAPGSDIATLSILSYDPRECYTGRGPLEALSLNLKPKPNELVFRCNLVTVTDNVMVDYSGGHISGSDGVQLIEVLNDKMSSDKIRFYPGVSYRNLLVIDEELLTDGDGELECTPPHDITGRGAEKYLPRGKGSSKLKELMEQSSKILSDTQVNRSKIERGENPANMIWPWSGGKIKQVEPFIKKFGLSGSIITAVDLLKGIGKLIGLKPVDVPGATGYYDTDYDAKARYSLASLKDGDFVFVHVEAADEAGHNGHIDEKVRAIENFDAKVVGPMLDGLEKMGPYRVMAMPDHRTPISTRTHSSDPVPAAIFGEGVEPDNVEKFDEFAVEKGKLGTIEGHKLLQVFTAKEIK